MSDKLPEIIVFAGPNGSGKSTITKMATIIPPYINADEITKANHCTNEEAANIADALRDKYISERKGFTFETVLSKRTKIDLLKRAKEEGFFIRCFYVLTVNPEINVSRVKVRVANGGHHVDDETVIRRYGSCIDLIPELKEVCDVLHIYDNTEEPFRIFKKRKSETFIWPNEFWDEDSIKELVGIK